MFYTDYYVRFSCLYYKFLASFLTFQVDNYEFYRNKTQTHTQIATLKPTTTDGTIPKSSCHPEHHKMATIKTALREGQYRSLASFWTVKNGTRTPDGLHCM